jgi:hypothetical protein
MITFTVMGLPPELVSGKSIWSSRRQSLRLLHARRAAFVAMNGRDLLTGPLSLQITVFAGRTRFDLDHIVSAAANFLASAPSKSRLDDVWHEPGNAEIWPHKALVYRNDKQIKLIHAEMLAPDGSTPGEYQYTVKVEQLEVSDGRTYMPALRS